MLETLQCKPNFRSVYLQVGGNRIHSYLSEAGPGRESVMFVHGYMAHAMAFRRVVQPFTGRYNVYVVDLPSHGRDPSFLQHGASPTMQWARQWLAAVIDEVQPDHLVGHSLGATLSYDVAQTRSDLETVTLVDPGMWLRKRALDAFALGAVPPRLARLAANDVTLRIFERFQWQGTAMSGQERKAYLHPMRDRARLRFMLRWGNDLLSNADPNRRLAPVDARTLLLWGENDGLFPVHDAPKMARAIDADLHVFPDAGHSPPEDVPKQFQEILLSFLDR